MVQSMLKAAGGVLEIASKVPPLLDAAVRLSEAAASPDAPDLVAMDARSVTSRAKLRPNTKQKAMKLKLSQRVVDEEERRGS